MIENETFWGIFKHYGHGMTQSIFNVFSHHFCSLRAPFKKTSLLRLMVVFKMWIYPIVSPIDLNVIKELKYVCQHCNYILEISFEPKRRCLFFLSFLFWCDTQKSFLYIKRNRKNSGVIINHSLLISVLKGISRRVLILFYSPGTHCLKILKMFNLENWRQKKFLLVNSWKRKWEGIISKAEKSFSYLFLNFSSHEENIP